MTVPKWQHLVCPECGIDFAVTANFWTFVIDRGKNKFFCPNGHSLSKKKEDIEPPKNDAMPDMRDYLEKIAGVKDEPIT
jgi:hypothetical protein